MENAADAAHQPQESALYGDVHATGGERFGYEWVKRTYGLGAIKIEWTSQGLRSLAIWVAISVEDTYMAGIFATTKTESWLRLVDDEYVTSIDLGVTDDRVSGVRFHTNLRQTQWFGSKAGRVEHLMPPPGYFVHMIYGRCHDGQCKNVGAYFVPLALRISPPSGYVHVDKSAAIGSVPIDPTSDQFFRYLEPSIRAIMVTIDVQPTRIRFLHSTEYLCHLAYHEAPLDDGDHMLLLIEGELVTGLRAWVGGDESISAIQLVTNRRTTEWFGRVPAANATIETRSIEDKPRATHIGGIVGMHGDDCMKAIRVEYYRVE